MKILNLYVFIILFAGCTANEEEIKGQDLLVTAKNFNPHDIYVTMNLYADYYFSNPESVGDFGEKMKLHEGPNLEIQSDLNQFGKNELFFFETDSSILMYWIGPDGTDDKMNNYKSHELISPVDDVNYKGDILLYEWFKRKQCSVKRNEWLTLYSENIKIQDKSIRKSMAQIIDTIMGVYYNNKIMPDESEWLNEKRIIIEIIPTENGNIVNVICDTFINYDYSLFVDDIRKNVKDFDFNGKVDRLIMNFELFESRFTDIGILIEDFKKGDFKVTDRLNEKK